MTLPDIRPSAIAGQWYEGDPKSLARSVDQYLDQAELPSLDGVVTAVIAPHAGHRYSGAVAGYAFAALRGQSFDLVVVLSPMHHPYYQPLITTSHQGYATPLGTILVENSILLELDKVLQDVLGYGLSPVARDPEHSLEIELPFLQRSLAGGWKLLPIMVRALEPRISERLGNALAEVLRNKNHVIVASTDLSHFYDQQTALALDQAMLHEIESFSPSGVFEAERLGKGYACGLGALAAALWAARDLGADSVKILKYATSGDITGDYSSVVGYGAAAVLKH